MKRLREKVYRKITDMCQDQSRVLHRNVATYTVPNVNQFLAKTPTTVFKNPPYSPDLALLFFL